MLSRTGGPFSPQFGERPSADGTTRQGLSAGVSRFVDNRRACFRGNVASMRYVIAIGSTVQEEQNSMRPTTSPTAVVEPLKVSARTMEICQRVLRGKTDAEIALDLSISRRTVNNTLSRLYDKVGVSSRAHIAYLVGLGRITGPQRG